MVWEIEGGRDREEEWVKEEKNRRNYARPLMKAIRHRKVAKDPLEERKTKREEERECKESEAEDAKKLA